MLERGIGDVGTAHLQTAAEGERRHKRGADGTRNLEMKVANTSSAVRADRFASPQRCRWRRGLAALMLLAMSLPAQAVVDCTGTVDNLSLHLDNSGTVTVSLSGGPSFVYLCTIDGVTTNGVSPAVCRSMYSTLALAKAMGKKVLIRFQNHTSCAAIPAWAQVGPLGWTQLLLD